MGEAWKKSRSAHRQRWRCGMFGVAVAAALIGGGQRGEAAGEPLSASFEVLGAGRSCAPRLASVTLTWNGTALLEGDLEVQVMRGDEHVTGSILSGLALTPGSQTFSMLLPAATPQFDGQTGAAKLLFRSGRRVINLENHRCPMPGLSDRNLMLAYPIPLTQERDVRSVGVAACIDRLCSQGKENVIGGTVRSSICALRPQDFPNTPEMYCAFDVVLLAGDGVSRMRMPQLEALKQWVRGGGAVLLANLRDIPPNQQAFFAELVNGSDAEGAFGFTPDGMQSGPRVLLAYNGNGRVAAFNDPKAFASLDELFKDREWIGMQGFLWHMRASQQRSVLGKALFDTGLESSTAAGDFTMPYRIENEIMRKNREGATLHLEPLDMLSAQNFLTTMMPTDMQFVQIRWLVIVLLALVIMVGPVDYFLLRRLKLQRYTWLTVPLYVTIATVVMVTMANRTMGRDERRSRLCVLDTDHTGAVVRQNDIYLVVPSGHGRLVEELNSALIAPVRIGNANHYYSECNALVSPFSIAGRYPQSYTAAVRVSQWKPMAWRTMTLQPKHAFPWTLPPVPAEFDTRNAARGYWSAFKALNSQEPVGAYILLRNERINLKNHHWPRKLGAGEQSPAMLTNLAEMPPVGYLSLVAGIPPACDSTLEDLALFDVTGDEAVLVLAWLDGDVICVSRTPFYADPAKRWMPDRDVVIAGHSSRNEE